jgi:hypothetical protein
MESVEAGWDNQWVIVRVRAHLMEARGADTKPGAIKSKLLPNGVVLGGSIMGTGYSRHRRLRHPGFGRG